MTEQLVRLVVHMYELRDAAKRIAGDTYAAKIADWKGALAQIAASLKVSPIQAVPMIAKANPVSDIEIMWLTAAAVELTEDAAVQSNVPQQEPNDGAQGVQDKR